MIEGLKFDVTSEELKKHLEDKIQHHLSREQFYRDQVDALEKGGAKDTGFSGGNPITALTEKAEKHANRQEMFIFLRDHIIPNETYRMQEQDLVRLEILSRYW